MLDAPVFAMPPIKAGSGSALRLAAQAHIAACEPSTKDQRERILIGLRSATQRRDETPKEARASFELLLAHLAAVPEDILAAECRRYAQTERFFPRGAADLKRAMIATANRSARAHRLRLMADQADHEDAERKRIAEIEEWTPEKIRELGKWAKGRMEAGWFTQAQLDAAFAQQTTTQTP